MLVDNVDYKNSYFLNRDAKIAALEKTSQDAEKMIAEARSEKMRHMDEVHAAQKKLADLESRSEFLDGFISITLTLSIIY